MEEENQGQTELIEVSPDTLLRNIVASQDEIKAMLQELLDRGAPLNAGSLAASNSMSFDNRAWGTPSKRPGPEKRDTEVPSAIECFENLPLTTPLSALKLKLLLDDLKQGRSFQKAAPNFTDDIEGLMQQLNCLKNMLKEMKSSMLFSRAEYFDAAHLLSRLEKLTSNYQPQ